MLHVGNTTLDFLNVNRSLGFSKSFRCETSICVLLPWPRYTVALDRGLGDGLHREHILTHCNCGDSAHIFNVFGNAPTLRQDLKWRRCKDKTDS
jgi:hypothetical protein